MQGTPVTSEFPRIGDYGFLSNCHTGALVAPDGSVEWLCLPRFDSPSVFGAILDRGAGRMRFGPVGLRVPLGRVYDPGTNVLESIWMTDTGWVTIRDALTIGEWRPEGSDPRARPPCDHDAEHVLVRTAHCFQGEVEIELDCEPLFDYGATPVRWRSADDAMTMDAEGGSLPVRLTGDLELTAKRGRAGATRVLREGEGAYCALSWAHELAAPASFEEAERSLDITSTFWRNWLADGDFPDHPWRRYLQRSALALKGLMYAPTGAMIAALTTSLPETPGGERNWDYRYTWVRDASFTLWALHTLGFDEEAQDFIKFVVRVCDRHPDLQIMYGIRGEHELTETTLDHLSGYEGARPVRIGNAAYKQRQNDVYGALLDSVYIHTKVKEQIPDDRWEIVRQQVETAAKAWIEPDQGIWESRGEPKHYVSSKLMCWVAMDRGSRLARHRKERQLVKRWRKTADEIRADILERGVSERGVFRQHYDTDALDASTLLVPLVRFLPPDDERIRNTALAIAEELTEGGLVLRYRVEETDDGLEGDEGTFAICSCWLVSALSEIGERRAARELCERLLAFQGDLNLYAEEIDGESGAQLGNFPQAFTHLALINAVSHVIADDMEVREPDAKTAVFSEMMGAVRGRR